MTGTGKPKCTGSQPRDGKDSVSHVNKGTLTVTIALNVVVTHLGQKDVGLGGTSGDCD